MALSFKVPIPAHNLLDHSIAIHLSSFLLRFDDTDVNQLVGKSTKRTAFSSHFDRQLSLVLGLLPPRRIVAVDVHGTPTL